MNLDEKESLELSRLIRKMSVILSSAGIKPMSNEEYGLEMFRNQQERTLLKTNPPTQKQANEYLLAVLKGKKNQYLVDKAGLELFIDATKADIASIDSEIAIIEALISRIAQ